MEKRVKEVSTPRNRQGLFAMIEFVPRPDGNFTCNVCEAVVPETILDEHAERHTPPEEHRAFPNAEFFQPREAPQTFTITRETPTEVMVRAIAEMDVRNLLPRRMEGCAEPAAVPCPLSTLPPRVFDAGIWRCAKQDWDWEKLHRTCQAPPSADSHYSRQLLQ